MKNHMQYMALSKIDVILKTFTVDLYRLSIFTV